MATMTMSRGKAVSTLYESTHLPGTTILGALAVLDKGGLPLTTENLVAAAFSAYKTYETNVPDQISDFQEHMVPDIPATALQADERKVLAAIDWTMPARTRMDCVANLAHELGVEGLDYERAAVLALLVDECKTMTDDQYARAILCAAVQMDRPEGRAWMRGLPTKSVSRDYILRWGLRVAAMAGNDPPAAHGAKRKRED